MKMSQHLSFKETRTTYLQNCVSTANARKNIRPLLKKIKKIVQDQKTLISGFA